MDAYLRVGCVHLVHEHKDVVVRKMPVVRGKVLQNGDGLLDALLELDESKRIESETSDGHERVKLRLDVHRLTSASSG